MRKVTRASRNKTTDYKNKEAKMPDECLDENSPLLTNRHKSNQTNDRQISMGTAIDVDNDYRPVFYEKRCLPNKSRFEESARAIFSCKYVIVVLSTAYLKDKRLQFELDLTQTAMTERYGYGAFNHLIFITAAPTGELTHWLPRQLRGIVNKSCIFWSDASTMQQNYFWEKIVNRITNHHA